MGGHLSDLDRTVREFVCSFDPNCKSPEKMKYLFTALVSVLIIVAVLIPGPNLPDVGMFGGLDKIVHIGMFGTWAVAVRYDFHRVPFRFFLVFLIGVSFSLFTEALQILVEGRSFDWFDFVADAGGLALGLAISKRVLNLLARFFGTKVI